VLGSGTLGFDDGSFSILAPASDSTLSNSLAEAVEAAGGAIEPSYEMLRILRGRPAEGHEYGAGAPVSAATPFELGLWASVHLDKGCYLGQEVLTRLARVKKPKRLLYGIQFDLASEGAAVQSGADVSLANAAEAASLAPGDDLLGGPPLAPPRSVGVVTSILVDPTSQTPTFGLVMVQPKHVPVGTRVVVGESTGTIVEIAAATRAGSQAGGGDDDEQAEDPDAEAKAAAAAAEAERKKKKLEAMAQKMKELGLA